MTLGPFYLGQIPAQPLLLEVQGSDRNPVDLTVYSQVRVRLFRPDGTEVETSGAYVNPVDTSQVVYSWPEMSIFTETGRWTAQLELSGPGPVLDYAAPTRFNVNPIGD